MFCGKCDNFMDITDDILIDKNIQYNKITENSSNYDDILTNESNAIDNDALSSSQNLKIKNKQEFFHCKNCGYNEEIKNETFIFSRNHNNDNDMFDTNIILNKYDTTLPYEKNYTCINKNCITHEKTELKKAIFYRKNNKYNVEYICYMCNTIFNI